MCFPNVAASYSSSSAHCPEILTFLQTSLAGIHSLGSISQSAHSIPTHCHWRSLSCRGFSKPLQTSSSSLPAALQTPCSRCCVHCWNPLQDLGCHSLSSQLKLFPEIAVKEKFFPPSRDCIPPRRQPISSGPKMQMSSPCFFIGLDSGQPVRAIVAPELQGHRSPWHNSSQFNLHLCPRIFSSLLHRNYPKHHSQTQDNLIVPFSNESLLVIMCVCVYLCMFVLICALYICFYFMWWHQSSSNMLNLGRVHVHCYIFRIISENKTNTIFKNYILVKFTVL